MPTRDVHIQQAEHNRQFWSSLNVTPPLFVDWVVTGIFYEALHWVEAFLASRDKHSATHNERLLALQQYAQMQSIRNDLFVLKNDSENARYRCYRHSAQDIGNDLIPRLTKIGRYVRGLL